MNALIPVGRSDVAELSVTPAVVVLTPGAGLSEVDELSAVATTGVLSPTGRSATVVESTTAFENAFVPAGRSDGGVLSTLDDADDLLPVGLSEVDVLSAVTASPLLEPATELLSVELSCVEAVAVWNDRAPESQYRESSIGPGMLCATAPGADAENDASCSISRAAKAGVVYVGVEIPVVLAPDEPALSSRPKMYVALPVCCEATVVPPGVQTGLPTAPALQSVTPMKSMELTPVRVNDPD